MSTPKHTPGPWHVGLKPGPMVYGPQGEQIVGLNVMLDSDEVLANAKFIAAAPAMYEALQYCVSDRNSYAMRKGTVADLKRRLRDINTIVETALAQAEDKP